MAALEAEVIFELAGLFLARFAVLAVGLSVAGYLFGRLLQGDARMIRLVVRRRLFTAMRIPHRSRREAFGGDVVSLVFTFTFACAAVLVALSFLFIPVLEIFRNHREPFNEMSSVIFVVLALFLVHVLGPTGLIRAIRWTDARELRVAPLPVIPRPLAQTVPDVRHGVAIDLYRFYLHRQLLMAAIWGAGMLHLLEVTTRDLQSGAIVTLAVMVLAMPPAFIFVELSMFLIGHRAPRLHVLTVIAAALQPEPTGRRRPADPERSRDRVVAVVRTSEQYADHLSQSQALSARHPLAHLLKLEAAYLRGYLAKPESLTSTPPDDVTRSIRRITTVLMGAEPTFVHTATAQLDDMTSDVTPTPPRRAWSARLSDVAGFLDTAIKPMTWLLVAAVGIVLVSAGRVSPEEIRSWLP